MKYVFGLSIEKLSAPLFHSSFKAKSCYHDNRKHTHTNTKPNSITGEVSFYDITLKMVHNIFEAAVNFSIIISYIKDC